MGNYEDTQELKRDILAEMAKIEDMNYRLTLSLVLRVIDVQDRLVLQMYDKLDALIKDENRIREVALNGHEAHHHEHHDWLEKNLFKGDGLDYALKLAEVHRPNNGQCAWSAKKIAEEQAQQAENKKAGRDFVRQGFFALMLFLAGVLAQDLVDYIRGEIRHANPSVPSSATFQGP